jgi:outer membrane protein
MSVFKRVLLLGSVALSLPALAHESGEIIIRAGATMVDPQEHSDNLMLDNRPLSLHGALSGIAVNSNTQLGVSVAYQLDPRFSVELLLATPFRHTVSGTGELAGVDIATVHHLPPTLSVLYHLPEVAGLQAYLGAGVNYTAFFNGKLTSSGATTLAGLGLQDGHASADNSWGLAVLMGVDYHLTPRLLLNASVRKISIGTKATISFANGSQLGTNLSIDPFVYSLGLGLVI